MNYSVMKSHNLQIVIKSLLTGADSILFVLGVCIIFLPFIKKYKKRAGIASSLPDTKKYNPSTALRI